MSSLREFGDARRIRRYRKRKIASLEGLGRAGGVYVPPFKLQRLQKELANKQGEEAQRQAWEALRPRTSN